MDGVVLGHQRTRPATPAVTASTTTTDGKVYVTWTGAAATGNITYYAQRQFGATYEPAVPVTFDQFTFAGVDQWAVPNNVYTYYVWSCSAGTENCSLDGHADGKTVGTATVASVTASDGTATYSDGTPYVEVLFPAVVNSTVTQYFGYRSDDAAGALGLTLLGSVAQPVGVGAIVGFDDHSGNLGQDYYYWVRACAAGADPASGGGAVCGAKSNVDAGWAPIPKPTITLVNSTSGVTASWSETDVNISYLGFRSPTSSFSAAIPVGGVAIAGLGGTDTSGVAGTTYYYFLKACLGTRCSPESVGKPGIKLVP
jgi:hypothetical protein